MDIPALRQEFLEVKKKYKKSKRMNLCFALFWVGLGFYCIHAYHSGEHQAFFESWQRQNPALYLNALSTILLGLALRNWNGNKELKLAEKLMKSITLAEHERNKSNNDPN